MGHYDECRDGYCSSCGAAPGNLRTDGTCPFCSPSKKEVVMKPRRAGTATAKAAIIDKEVTRLRAESAVFRAMIKAIPTTLTNAQALEAWLRFQEEIHQSLALDKVWKDTSLPYNGSKDHPAVLSDCGDYEFPISADTRGEINDPLRWIDNWAEVIQKTRRDFGEPYSVNFAGDGVDDIAIRIYRHRTAEEKAKIETDAAMKKRSKADYHLKSLRDILGPDADKLISEALAKGKTTLAEAAQAPAKLSARKGSMLRSKK